MKKSVAIVLSLLLLLGSFSVGASAAFTEQTWKTYYDEQMKNGYAVYMNPGADESQRNFSWYAPLGEKPGKVVISENENFSLSRVFEAKYVLTAEGDRSDKVTVTGLKADTTYYYRCMLGNKIIRQASFVTDAKDAFTAVYMTDIHISREQDEMDEPLMKQSLMLNNVLEQAADKAEYNLILSAGDQASYGDRKEYMSLVTSPVFSSVPISLAVGNHDRKGIAYKTFNNNPNKYQKGVSSLIGNDYYYVKGNVLFMVFDSNNKAAATHYNFVKQAIAANPNVKWKVGIMHHDLYGRLTSGRLEDSNENRRPVFIPIFDEFGFDLVLLGHSHYYSVSHALYNGEIATAMSKDGTVTNPKGTVYMVSNSINHPRDLAETASIIPDPGNAVAIQKDGAAYNLIDFTEDSISVRSYAMNEAEPFNTFTITKTTQQGGHPNNRKTPMQALTRMWYEFLALWTEIGEGIGAIYKNYFEK